MQAELPVEVTHRFHVSRGTLPLSTLAVIVIDPPGAILAESAVIVKTVGVVEGVGDPAGVAAGLWAGCGAGWLAWHCCANEAARIKAHVIVITRKDFLIALALRLNDFQITSLIMSNNDSSTLIPSSCNRNIFVAITS